MYESRRLVRMMLSVTILLATGSNGVLNAVEDVLVCELYPPFWVITNSSVGEDDDLRAPGDIGGGLGRWKVVVRDQEEVSNRKYLTL